jgi:hypothetical protein
MELSERVYYEEKLRSLDPKTMKSATVIVECPGEIDENHLKIIESVIREKGYVPNAFLPNYNPVTNTTELHIHTYFDKSKTN